MQELVEEAMKLFGFKNNVFFQHHEETWDKRVDVQDIDEKKDRDKLFLVDDVKVRKVDYI